MKMVSIQGFGAKNLGIPGERIRSFESALCAIAGTRVFLVSSPYRTDVLYHSPKDYSSEIISLWLLYANADEEYRSKFFVTSTKKDTLEGFFIRLVYLSTNRYWFNRYIPALRQKLGEKPLSRIARDLTKCQDFINNEGIHRIFEFNNEGSAYTVVPGLPSDISKSCLDAYRLN
ncbi:MAG: hypothetical protein P8X57_01490 [Cyclobacteriaceae bacterium]